MMRTPKSILALVAAAVIVGQVLTGQRAVIEQRDRRAPLWSNSDATRVLVRACGNCHSNHTDWPWYSHVAPVSWWIGQHVREGREKLDFSDWERYSAWQKHDKLDSMCGLISTGRMPPWLYTTMHPEAKLTKEDKKAVCVWVKEQTVAAR
jgi:Haem-binding domain